MQYWQRIRVFSTGDVLTYQSKSFDEYREEIREICSVEEIIGIYSDLTGFIPAGTRMILCRTLMVVRSL
jgi:hypothetical protein